MLNLVPSLETIGVLEIVWLAISLYGLTVLIPQFRRFDARVRWLSGGGQNGERIRRARGLRRRTVAYSIILGLNVAIGYWALLLAPPVSVRGSWYETFTSLASFATAILIVIDAKCEEIDFRWIERYGVRRNRRREDAERTSQGGK
jgi:hypothetical protein